MRSGDSAARSSASDARPNKKKHKLQEDGFHTPFSTISFDAIVSTKTKHFAIVGAASCLKAPDVTGDWNWVCPGSPYSGRLELRQFRDGKISGAMYDAGGGEPTQLTGRIKGNFVEFTRTWDDAHEQRFRLALGPNGKKLVGAFDGNRDTSVGTDFETNRN